MATTKNVKLGATYPPAEVRENTKARRAWLAAEVERRQQEPNVTAKVCGTGSYQYVSASRAVVVVGRIRHRGNCQCCGGLQVVDGGVLVLHGYTRPGDGFITGRCPGVGQKPQQADITLTLAWLALANEDVARLTQDLAVATAQEEAASAAQFTNTTDDYTRIEGYPREPRAPHVSRWETPSAEAVEQYRAALRAFAEQFPLTHAHNVAEIAVRQTRDAQWKAQEMQRHFQFWIDAKLLGTALIEETVA